MMVGFFSFIFCAFLLLTVIIILNYYFNVTERVNIVMVRTGPNDTRHVVWACSEFFPCFLLLLTFMEVKEGREGAQMRRVVWVGKFFFSFLFFHVFYH